MTYNDETKTLYGSYGVVENGEVTIYGVSIKAINHNENRAYFRQAGYAQSGTMENTYPEATLLIGGTRAGIGLLKYFWNQMIRPVVISGEERDMDTMK